MLGQTTIAGMLVRCNQKHPERGIGKRKNIVQKAILSIEKSTPPANVLLFELPIFEFQSILK